MEEKENDMRNILMVISMVAVFGLVMASEGYFLNSYSLSISMPKAEAARIKTRGKCASAKKQYKSYNRALKRQIKDLKKAHRRIYKVSPNRIVGYTQEVLNKADGVTRVARNLKTQAGIIQRNCVEKKQAAEPLI